MPTYQTSLSIIIVLWLIVLISCSTPGSLSSQNQLTREDTSPHKSIGQMQGWKPQDACGFLSHISGLQTGSYKNEYDDVFGCISHYKELGSDFPLSNNIAYYVKGNEQSVTELKIVFNVNVRDKAKEAQATLLNYSDELTKKALGVPLPKDVKNAITAGKAGQWTVEKSKIEIKRDDWPTGRGYELHYTITKSA